MKKSLFTVIAAVVFLSIFFKDTGFCTNAANIQQSPSEQTAETDETKETELQPVLLDTDTVSTDEILLFSGAGIVMDLESGRVLYYKNPYIKLYPASLTKILTALIALDKTKPEDTLTITQYALDNITYDSSQLGAAAGQTLTMNEALYTLMLSSANDVANAVAEHISGSIEAFSDLMNSYAEKLGCYHSHFVNPSGLHDDAHYSSVFDIAMIARAAAMKPGFLEMSGSNTYTLQSEVKFPETENAESSGETDPEEPKPLTLYNHHKMINNAFPYAYACAGKTGYTHKARNTLATYAQKDGRRLVCIMFDCPGGKNYVYTDTSLALDYCFEHYDALISASEIKACPPSDKTLFMYKKTDMPPVTLDGSGQGLLDKTYRTYYEMTAKSADGKSLNALMAQKAAQLLDFDNTKDKTWQEYAAGIGIIAICILCLMFIIRWAVLKVKRRRRRMRYRKLKNERLNNDRV